MGIISDIVNYDFRTFSKTQILLAIGAILVISVASIIISDDYLLPLMGIYIGLATSVFLLMAILTLIPSLNRKFGGRKIGSTVFPWVLIGTTVAMIFFVIIVSWLTSFNDISKYSEFGARNVIRVEDVQLYIDFVLVRLAEWDFILIAGILLLLGAYYTVADDDRRMIIGLITILTVLIFMLETAEDVVTVTDRGGVDLMFIIILLLLLPSIALFFFGSALGAIFNYVAGTVGLGSRTVGSSDSLMKEIMSRKTMAYMLIPAGLLVIVAFMAFAPTDPTIIPVGDNRFEVEFHNGEFIVEVPSTYFEDHPKLGNPIAAFELSAFNEISARGLDYLTPHYNTMIDYDENTNILTLQNDYYSLSDEGILLFEAGDFVVLRFEYNIEPSIGANPFHTLFGGFGDVWQLVLAAFIIIAGGVVFVQFMYFFGVKQIFLRNNKPRQRTRSQKMKRKRIN